MLRINICTTFQASTRYQPSPQRHSCHPAHDQRLDSTLTYQSGLEPHRQLPKPHLPTNPSEAISKCTTISLQHCIRSFAGRAIGLAPFPHRQTSSRPSDSSACWGHSNHGPLTTLSPATSSCSGAASHRGRVHAYGRDRQRQFC